MNSNNISKYSRKQICEALKYWKRLLRESTIPSEDTYGEFDGFANEAEDEEKADDKEDDSKGSDPENDTLKQAIEIIQQQLDVIKNSLGIETGSADAGIEAPADDDFGDFDFGDGSDDAETKNTKKKSKKNDSKKDDDDDDED